MTKTILRAIPYLFLIFICLTGCNRKPKTHKDQVSYTIGAQFGKSLKAQNLDLDTDALARGISEGYSGNRPRMSEDEMQKTMMKMSDDRQQVVRNEAANNQKVGQAFLAQNKSVPGVKATASGLQYKIISPGTGPMPKIEDSVVIHFKGSLTSGAEFDSSYKRNEPAQFPLRGVIRGWAEGLQLLRKGGKATFYIPPELGYGDSPRENIPAGSVLVFDVELLDVKPGLKKN